MPPSAAAAAAPQRPGLGRLIEAAGCRALLVVAQSARDPDLAPFVGGAHLGQSFLIARPGATSLAYLTDMERQEAAATGCALLTPAALGMTELLERDLDEAERLTALLERALQLAGIAAGPVALAGRAPAGALLAATPRLAAAGWQLVDGSALARRVRKHKTAAERGEMRRVAAATVAAFAEVAGLLAAAAEQQGELWLGGERLTAGRLRAAVAARFAAAGLEQPEGNLVAAGADAAVPHSQGDSARVLRSGEALIVDLFPRRRLFADCTRTFCVGPPPPALAEAHRLVLTVLEAAHAAAVPGARGRQLQEAACERFEAAGWSTPRSAPGSVRGYVHNLGHGVGFELHELPSFRSLGEEDGVLAAGDVFTLEPGLYDPEAGWGVRLEDLCALGEDGLENLTPAPYDLDPRAWSAQRLPGRGGGG